MRNSLFAMLLVASSGLSAQTTFNVDMTCAPAGFTDVFVTGPWCGWCANDTYNTMTDDDGDGIYSVSVTIDGVALGDLVEYKYAINGFADQENLVNDMVDGASCAPVTDFAGYANRQIPAGDTANDSYGTCDGTCNDGSAVSTTADVTFQVDMNDYAGAFGTVNLNGSFNAWCGGCAALTDGDADGVYDIVVALEPGTYEYKFTLDGWTAQEEFTDGDACTTTIDGFVNRTVTVTESATLPVVCYNSCDVCDGTSTGGGGETTMGVTFNVDMACATAPGATVNGATEITELFVTGPWCGWCAADGYNVMTDADGDGVFTVEIADLTGEVEYKYGINGFADQEQLVDDMVDGADCAPVTDFAGFANRLINAGSVANDIFGACALCDTTDNGGGNNGGGETAMGVTFNVDMACATAPGATVNGATEITELFVTGPWCGWCAADGYNVMTDADGDGVFTVEIADLTGEIEYKYGINGFADQEQLVDDMVDGADCAPVTDFAGYANRLINAGSVANDIFGACALCDTTDNGGGNNGGGQDSTLTGLANLTFDEAASVLPWEAIADATLPEATLAWNENGVETGALEFGGNNTTDGVGRAYIFQYLDANVDYAGATSVTLTFDAKLASPLESAALHMQTEFPGVGTTNNFDLQTQGLNEAGWTGYSFTFDNVSGNGIFRIQFNVASGAFVGAGGIVLLDNVAIAGGGDGGGDNGGGSDATTFQVDMACATQPGAMTNGTTEIAELFVTGPWCGWCGPEGYNVLTDVDGDGVFAVEVEGLSGEIEYKYAVNAFTDQEQLVDDMVAGADCAPVTDFSGFANRLTQAGSTTNDVFGSCSACEAVEGDGCTNPSYLEFDPYATVDDGSCVTLVVYGCPYEAATNYNPLANVDNLTCEFDGTGNNTCPSDLNGDGSVTTADLLVFLVSFGELCDE